MQSCNTYNYINTNSVFAFIDISNIIMEHLTTSINYKQDLIILCIGTDRSTGDSLGPLVGHKLKPLIPSYSGVSLYGTLDEPIHAKNLVKTISNIDNSYDDPFIIAIDASLGNLNRVGYINIRKGPLKPGLGVNKDLPLVGDISITGVVNVGGLMEYMVLQNTRLNLVMGMARVISKGLHRTLYTIYDSRYA